MDRNDYIRINQVIKHCWDSNVVTRGADLEQATDTSYVNHIKPWVLGKIQRLTTEQSKILDIGCGCGYLTNAVYEVGRHETVGIDISEKSIEYARSKYPNIEFECHDICCRSEKEHYDLCLSIMLLNNMPNIDCFFSSVSKVLKPDGKLLIVIPHPCFWPSRHIHSADFRYQNEQAYEFSFSTKGRSDYASNILFFHRTLETYTDCIYRHDFEIVDLHELNEDPENIFPDILCLEVKHRTGQ